MTEQFKHPRFASINTGRSASSDTGTTKPVSGRRHLAGQKSGPFPHAAHAALLGSGGNVGRYDPHEVQRQFPVRWKAYIRALYVNIDHVQRVFPVSERTARKWWNGETGANGSNVAIAVLEHPVAAPRLLFAAE